MKTDRQTMEPSVLLVSNAVIPRSGGFPKTMRKFAAALDAGIISFTSQREASSELEAFPEVTHVPTEKGRLLDWYAYAGGNARATAEAMAGKADLLSCHVMLRYHANWVAGIAKRYGTPYWFVPHGQLDPYVYTYRGGVKRLWLKVFGKRLLRGAAHVIFSTEREREKAKWFYEGANTRVVHWPVDLIDIGGKPAARRSLRERLGIGEDARVVLFLGRLHSMKRPLDTIDAFAAAGCGNAHLVFVGPEDDVSEQDCRTRAAQLGLGDEVHVTGPIFGGEKEMFLLGADAYVSLSERENFGHTAAESLAAGTPVILSPGNDLSPELEPRDCGWFLKSNTLEEAAEAIGEAVAADADQLGAMGARGREFVRDECSFEGFRAALQQLHAEATAGGRKR